MRTKTKLKPIRESVRTGTGTKATLNMNKNRTLKVKTDNKME